ncbi:hypothetical protein G6F22_021222 [Rhizopus arrhizus]|nr:hypothetical protein G6F22_021222 [Rhizopus arrhizus]
MSHASLQPGGGQPVSAGTRPVASAPKNTSFVYLDDGSRGHADPTPARALDTAEIPGDRKRTRLNSSHQGTARMPSSA